MRDPIEIPPYYAALTLCTVILVALVFAEGSTWPLKAAACMHDPSVAPHRLNRRTRRVKVPPMG